MGERGEHLLTLGLQGVDAQIERGAARHRGGLRHAVVAEHLRQIGIEPFGVIAGDMGRRILERARTQRGALGVGQRRRRKAAAVAESRDRVGIELALEPEHAERAGPRRVRVHDPGAGGAAAQHVPDQA